MKQNKAKQLSKFTIGYIGLGKMGLNMACNIDDNALLIPSQ